MRRLILALALLVSAVAPGLAQSTRTIPFAVRTADLSSTITLTGTFQSLQAANNDRKGCFIQNNGTNNMKVYFGPIASATANNSVVLTPGQPLNCIEGGVILTDQVSITGTTADAFTEYFQ